MTNCLQCVRIRIILSSTCTSTTVLPYVQAIISVPVLTPHRRVTGDNMSLQIFTTLGEVCTIKCCVYFVLCVLARESISSSSVTISAVGNFNQTNGVNPLLADICNFSSLSSIGRNSVYVGCSWRLPSSEWLCRWRW